MHDRTLLLAKSLVADRHAAADSRHAAADSRHAVARNAASDVELRAEERRPRAAAVRRAMAVLVHARASSRMRLQMPHGHRP